MGLAHSCQFVCSLLEHAALLGFSFTYRAVCYSIHSFTLLFFSPSILFELRLRGCVYLYFCNCSLHSGVCVHHISLVLAPRDATQRLLTPHRLKQHGGQSPVVLWENVSGMDARS